MQNRIRRKSMKLVIIFLILNLTSITFAEEKEKNTVYKYKDYEVIDLGSLEIKGQIIAPGDITISEKERKVFKRSLLEKDNFDYENKREIENLR
jgi:hypothetical protein